MTKRENLLRVLRGQRPGWIPCSINFSQWYSHHRRFNTLPEELRSTDSYVAAMKVLGCDLFTRNVEGGYRESFEGVEVRRRSVDGEQGPRTIGEIDTPHGTLRRIDEDQASQSTSYVVEDWIKDWPREGKAFLWLMERLKCGWDQNVFAATEEAIGDDGVLMVPIGCTPLKFLHKYFGLDYACLFVMDEPEAAKTICEMYWQRIWPVLQEMAGHPRVAAAILMDNVDAPFYSPELCKRYWTPYVRQAADLFAGSGKRLFVHACGKLRALKSTFIESHVHGLEGMAHPPLGDWRPGDSLDMPEPFIYNGGFTAQEQVLKSDDEIVAFYDRLFAELGEFPRFIFGAACQTTVHTPWERIKRVVQLCRENSPIRDT